MSRPDAVFAAFVEANPVPDESAISDDRRSATRFLGTLERGGTPMSEITEIRGEHDESASVIEQRNEKRRRPPGGRWMAAAAAFLGVLLVGGFVYALVTSGDAEPAQPPDPVEVAETEALALARSWVTAMGEGDVDTILAMAREDQKDLANRRLYEFQAVFASFGMGGDLQGCEIASSVPGYVFVECTVVESDPVARAVGVSEVTVPFRYSVGSLTWQPFEDAEFSLVNEAYAEYMSLYHPAQYESVCSPDAYEPRAIVTDAGRALTGECAAVEAPLAEDIAQWVRDGRPQP